MTQPFYMREISQYHLIVTETAHYLCFRGHKTALCRGIRQFTSFKSNLSVKTKLLTYHLYATQFSWSPQAFKFEISGAWKICRVCVRYVTKVAHFRYKSARFTLQKCPYPRLSLSLSLSLDVRWALL